MERAELTKETKNSFDDRNGFFMDTAYSNFAMPPHRAPSKKIQGSHSEDEREDLRRMSSPERALPATAVASQPGGAPRSKWTRKSRPWNVTGSTAVVASASIRELWLDPESTGTKPSTIGEGSEAPAKLARSFKGGSCGQVARKGSRILDSLVQSASGRGRSRGRLILPI
jgi:hypothetical protein